MSTPTLETYNFLNKICSAINKECFNNELPDVVLTLKGKGRTFGYYKNKAYISHGGEIVDEIAVNPTCFATHGFKELLQTLGHEMCHQWQYHLGKPSKRSYHNAEFAKKMKSIGLIPSDTGEEGGKETGQQMMDYMDSKGALVDLYNNMENEGIYIPWYERLSSTTGASELSDDLPEMLIELEENETSSNTTRTRYAHKCGDEKRATIIYGKAGIPLVCGSCSEEWIEDIT